MDLIINVLGFGFELHLSEPIFILVILGTLAVLAWRSIYVAGNRD